MEQVVTGQVNAFKRAWLDLKMALAVCHAAEECEMQVAHWIFEGRAGLPALLAIRQQVKMQGAVEGEGVLPETLIAGR